MLFLAALLLIAGALWLGYSAGRSGLLDEQSRAISIAISSENDFYRETGLHGTLLLTGHESRLPHDYAVVKLSDLHRALDMRGQVADSEIAEPVEDPAGADEVVDNRLFLPSPELARIIGEGPFPQAEVMRRTWEYVEKHQLEDAESSTLVNCDPALMAVTGVAKFSLFSMAKLINEHLRLVR